MMTQTHPNLRPVSPHQEGEYVRTLKARGMVPAGSIGLIRHISDQAERNHAVTTGVATEFYSAEELEAVDRPPVRSEVGPLARGLLETEAEGNRLVGVFVALAAAYFAGHVVAFLVGVLVR